MVRYESVMLGTFMQSVLPNRYGCAKGLKRAFNGPGTALFLGFSRDGFHYHRSAPRTALINEDWLSNIIYIRSTTSYISRGDKTYVYFGAQSALSKAIRLPYVPSELVK